MNSGNSPRNDGEKSDDGFVAVNVAELGVAVDRPPATPRTMSKSLSRKGGPPRSSGGGVGGGEAVSVLTLDGPGVKDKPLYVAVEGEAEVAASAAVNRHRRAATGRRPPGWRDPRRVLLVFASLSCMGTLILLYFTIAISRMNNGTIVDDDSG
ncbi:uncharacterized protein LOC122011794 [Zingiber officinale]|uniref:uncharacterized protein LOC122011794 n=1 Tax=Zingiber officinale TaxID=94328 RepID=UPI001C4C6E02|nr:uncharacterized protein LOC122011794 [Zingiber officinale]XP_042424112.1 uncharacterized protein LOC122011794 [Zingiber officinale]